jgi:hypothetical protein
LELVQIVIRTRSNNYWSSFKYTGLSKVSVIGAKVFNEVLQVPCAYMVPLF